MTVQAGSDVVRVADRVTPRNEGRGPSGPGGPAVEVSVAAKQRWSPRHISSSLDHPDHLDQNNGDKGFSGPGGEPTPGPGRTEAAARAAVVTRDQAGRWLKGASSPNPSGLSKDIAQGVLEVRRLLLDHSPQAAQRLVTLLDSEDDRVALTAAMAILDRSGAKPFSTEPERLEVTAVPMDVEQLRATLAQRVAALLPPAARELPPAVDVSPEGGEQAPGSGVGVGYGARDAGAPEATGAQPPETRGGFER